MTLKRAIIDFRFIKDLGFIIIFTLVMSRQSLGNIHYNDEGRDWTGICSTGKSQSPIDIPIKWATESDNLLFLKTSSTLDVMVSQKQMSNLTLKDNIYTYYYAFTGGYLAFWDESNNLDTYQLLQFHVHAPSEHTFNGKHYDVEIHFVHQNTNNNKLVAFGLFFDSRTGGDKENEFITALGVGKSNNTALSEIPALNLLKNLNFKEIFHYEGSLTTPPCSEVVSWILIHDVQPISSAQVKDFNNKWMNNKTFAGGKGNNREVQQLNQRFIYKKDTASMQDQAIIIDGVCFIMLLLFAIYLS
ncbi:UNKNOWN [Stylonychia lemnae]|uniref:carbonic anhydrase n=1 Tax=Stylonychia lemnae TaxID=5949 RepID=A0A077ZZW6_STYLE|nr:UNKNOWN [Stylonychia lemnae]|eukprot:CDW75440.1 UNKNOWN [Stylonychia lemnae]